MSDVTPNADEIELVRRCVSGDEAALTQFVKTYERAVFTLCLQMLRNRADAEDSAQESLVRACRSLHKWDGKRPLMPWLRTITANRCRTALEKRTRRSVTSLMGDVVAGSTDPGASMEAAAVVDEVDRALAELPENWATAVTMHYRGGLSCAVIAEAFGCAEGTVKTWLFRARGRLADLLSPAPEAVEKENAR